MRVLDLFSGIGGFSLGLERAGMKTVAFCEIEEYPRKVLAKHWPEVPCYEDIRELSGERLAADGIAVDLICGGYPCQPFSTAGKRKGAGDDRHLWPEYLRLIREIRPRWIIGENVAGHISMGLDEVLVDLEGEAYTWESFIVPACAVDAPHRRDRVWIIAHSSGDRIRQQPRRRSRESRKSEALTELYGAERHFITYDTGNRCHQRRGSVSETWSDGFVGNIGWPNQPSVCGADDGIPARMDRLKALGNAVVPQIPEMIGRAIMALSTSPVSES